MTLTIYRKRITFLSQITLLSIRLRHPYMGYHMVISDYSNIILMKQRDRITCNKYTTELCTLLLLLLLRLFPIGGVSGPNSWFPECSVLGILQGDPQCLHIPSDAIHPSPSWFPLGLFPGTLMSTTALTSLFSSILCMCPYQRSLISLTFSCMLFITSFFLMSALFTLSLSLCNCVHYKDFKVLKEFLFFTICDTKECVHYKEFKVLKECLFFTIWDTKECVHYKEFKVLKECLFFTIWDTKECVHYKEFKVLKEFLFFTICDTKECVHYKEFKVIKECLFFTIWDTKGSISGSKESISSERIQ